MVVFGVLGPLSAENDAGPITLKGPRQRAVLARLLIAHGHVVPVGRLIDDLWSEPPPGAMSAIQTFVSDLRRALEPDRPPRQPARLLVTAPTGYALLADPRAVDAGQFEAALHEATTAQASRALTILEQGLARWRGPAYAENADEPWARAEILRLDELRILASERRAEALMALGRPAEATADLQTHADGHPLREDAWRLLAIALYQSGRQGDALAALRRARQLLIDELGVDPGPRLRQVEADILAQAPRLNPFVTRTEMALAPRPPTNAGSELTRPTEQAPLQGEEPARRLIGRGDELTMLDEAAERAIKNRQPSLVLISGDPGEGKTALAEALTHRLAVRGWITAWGRCPEYDGAPVAWPWTQIDEVLPGTASPVTEPGDDPASARFRMRRAAIARLAAQHDPVLLVVDDIHRADDVTLDLLTGLAADPQTGPVLIVATYRATEITSDLTAALARFARTEPLRIYLGGLTETATGQLIGEVTGTLPDPAAAAHIQRRSGGNAFFIRELARLLAVDGDPALEQIPAGVREVIRYRLARLPESARTLMRQAAVAGRTVDVDVLIALTGTETPVLDALDRALQAGFLTEEPSGLRFTHILVRDTLYDDLSALRRAHWHAAIGTVIEDLHPDDVTTLAHHFTRAADRATAARAAHYARIVAERAERQVHPHESARWWAEALAAHDRAGSGDIREKLDVILGLGRTLAISGHLDEARRYRTEAVTTAERLGDPDLTADVITAFDVPAIWVRNDDEQLSGRIVAIAQRTLAALDPGRTRQRSRLLSSIALELRGATDDRGERAAREAETLARTIDDPAVLAFALNARFMHSFGRAGLAAERARIGAELVELAAHHGLVTFEVLGRLILLQARCALDDFPAADAEATAVDMLAERYDLPLVSVFTWWYAALRLAVSGDPVEARAAYRLAATHLAASAMPGMEDGLLSFAQFALDPDHRRSDDVPWGPYEPWVRPLILLAGGRRNDAADALRSLPESPRDLMLEARLCLAARAAVALSDRKAMENLRDRLLPAAHELAGAGSGVLTLGPVSGYLAELAEALGQP